MAGWSDIPMGVAIAVLLLDRMVHYVKQLRSEGKNGSGGNGNSGNRSVDFWRAQMSEIVYTELERHVIPPLKDNEEKLAVIENVVNELKWRAKNGRRSD